MGRGGQLQVCLEVAAESREMLSRPLGLRFSQERGEWEADSLKSRRNSINHVGTWEHMTSWATVRSSEEQKFLGREVRRMC